MLKIGSVKKRVGKKRKAKKRKEKKALKLTKSEAEWNGTKLMINRFKTRKKN